MSKQLLILWIVLLSVSMSYAQRDTIDTAFIAWNPDGNYIAMGYDHQIDIIDVSTMASVNTFELSSWAGEPVWSPDGQMIGFGNDTYLEVWQTPWDIQSNEQVASFDNGLRSRRSIEVAWHPNGNIIAVSSGIVVNFLDITSKTISSTAYGENPSLVADLTWSSTGEQLAVARYNNISEVWDFPSQETALIIYLEDKFDDQAHRILPALSSIDWSPDDLRIVYGGNTSFTSVDLNTFDNMRLSFPVMRLSYWGHHGNVNSVDWHPTGNRIASGGDDGTVRIWNAETGKQIDMTSLGDGVYVKSVAWSPDGNYLAYGSVDFELVIIDVPLPETHR